MPSLIEAVSAVEYALKNPAPNLAVDLSEAKQKAKQPSEKPRLRLSYGKRCAREKWYIQHEPEQAGPPDPNMEIRWTNGNVWEAFCIARLHNGLREPWSISLRDWQRTVEVTNDRVPDTWNQVLRGHLDGILRYNHEPYAVIDPKETSKWAFKKKWHNGRLPDPMWGYLHQAGNYHAALKREGVELQGHLWPVRTIEYGDIHVGWARPEELLPYHEEAMKVFAMALDPAPPPRIESFPENPPCRSKTTIYCDFYRHCSGDGR